MRVKVGGFGLVVVIQFLVLFGTFVLLLNIQVNHAQSQVESHKRIQVAQVMAESGLDYARHQLRTKRWLTAREFTSPSFGQGQHFAITATPLGGGRWALVSVGRVGPTEIRLKGAYP